MSVRLRRARPGDLPAIVAIKESLALGPMQRPERGGFLLGCSAERYAELIRVANVLLLEEAGEATGFAVTLPDPVLRSSELWERRALIHWHDGESEPPADEQVAYFDQLALRPRSRRYYASALALAAGRALAEAGHAHLYATILDRPVRNEAALPLLRALQARPVGLVEEYYPGVGAVASELWHSALPSALAAIDGTMIGARTAASSTRLAA